MWKLPTVWCCWRAECKEGCERGTWRSQLEALDEFHVAGESLRKSSGSQQREDVSSPLAIFLSLCPAGDLDLLWRRAHGPQAPFQPQSIVQSPRWSSSWVQQAAMLQASLNGSFPDRVSLPTALKYLKGKSFCWVLSYVYIARLIFKSFSKKKGMFPPNKKYIKLQYTKKDKIAVALLNPSGEACSSGPSLCPL